MRMAIDERYVRMNFERCSSELDQNHSHGHPTSRARDDRLNPCACAVSYLSEEYQSPDQRLFLIKLKSGDEIRTLAEHVQE